MPENKEMTVSYDVEITETLQKTVTVQLPPNMRYEAVQMVRQMYRNEEIVLTESDHVCTDIKLVNND